MTATGARLRRDDGMTLVELMIAAAILFIVITGMLPLMLQTTKMSSQAKAQTMATNYVNSMIEEIRSMPYEQVGIVDSELLPGSLEASRTATLDDGYTINVSLAIEWVDDASMPGAENYKHLSVNAIVTAPDRPDLTYSTGTFIWGSPYGGGDAPPPIVTFSSSSPAPEAVVFGTVAVGGDALTNASSGTIARMAIKVGSEFMPNSTLDFAYFESDPMESTADVSWLWDTEASKALVDEYGVPLKDPEGNPMYFYFSEDGYRDIKVEAWDNIGTYNYVTRRVLVDNYAPKKCAWVSLAPNRSTGLNASWAEAADGSDGAWEYNLRLWKEPKTPADPNSWTVTNSTVEQALSAPLTAAAFTRYKLEVQSSSVRHLKASPEEWVSSEIMTTPPELTGTFTRTATETAKNSKKYALVTNVTTSLTDPTFLSNAPAYYEVFRATSLELLGTTAPVAAGVAYDAGSWTDTITDPVAYTAGQMSPGYYYRVRAWITPVTGGTDAVPVWSNIGFVPGLQIPSKGTSYPSAPLVMQW